VIGGLFIAGTFLLFSFGSIDEFTVHVILKIIVKTLTIPFTAMITTLQTKKF
jgi:hypothetical protein